MNEHQKAINRRHLLQTTGLGIGSIALQWLCNQESLAAKSGAPSASRTAHHPRRAKHVIYLHMTGGPSTIDLFDNKPKLKQYAGRPMPESFTKGQRFAFIKPDAKVMPSQFDYQRHGDSGREISQALPQLAELADEIAVIKTIHTEQFNHAPAQLFMHTGFERFGRPSLGAWVTYGLGSENENLPAYVVLNSGGKIAGAGNALWGNGFLPSVYQGIQFRNNGDPVLFLSNPPGISQSDRKRMIDDLQKLNRMQLAEFGDSEIATRINQYEMAFRMQSSVPELADLSKEPKSIHKMYGTKPGKTDFANHCLLARRLVEHGVRFVQLFNIGWDHHGNVRQGLTNKCRQIDQPIAALIRDLKARGLLDETLIVWGGEFGRTPMAQGTGRDHHKDAFCVWLAGGGIRGGSTLGKTDDFGYYPIEDSVHVNDLHATILHLLGMNHTELTYKFQGRDFRLTDVSGVVQEKIIL